MKKWLSMFLVLVMLITSVPLDVGFAGSQGSVGSVKLGGKPNPNGGSKAANKIYAISILGAAQGVELKDPLKSIDKLTQITKSIVDEYSNKFPALENAIFFSPNALAPDSMKIGWYDAGSGVIHYAPATDWNYTFRRADTTPSKATPVLNATFLAKVLASPDKDLRVLGEGNWWKSNIASMTPNVAINHWSYFLNEAMTQSVSSGTTYDTRVKEFLFNVTDTSNLLTKQKSQLAYLELLISLYVLSPPGDKGWVESKIKAVITNDKQDVSPELIGVVPCIEFTGVIDDAGKPINSL